MWFDVWAMSHYSIIVKFKWICSNFLHSLKPALKTWRTSILIAILAVGFPLVLCNKICSFLLLVSGDNKYLLVALVREVHSVNIWDVWSIRDLFFSKVSDVFLWLDEQVSFLAPIWIHVRGKGTKYLSKTICFECVPHITFLTMFSLKTKFSNA